MNEALKSINQHKKPAFDEKAGFEKSAK